MKKILLGSIIGLMVLVVILLTNKPTVSYGIGPVLRSGINVTSMNSAGSLLSNATTSAAFLRNGLGTSTLTFASDNFDALSVSMRVNASSTNMLGFVQMNVQLSDDGIDYYDFDPTVLNPAAVYTASTTIQLASTTVPWQYRSPIRGAGATTTKAFLVQTPPSRFTRLIFSEGSSTPVTAAAGVSDETFLFVNVIGKLSSTVR